MEEKMGKLIADKISISYGHKNILSNVTYTFKTGFFYLRITSTYVENTSPFIPVLAANWDHLHIRGEYTKRSLIIEPFQFYEN